MLASIAVAVVVAAQWTEPGMPIDLAALILAAVVLVSPALVERTPGEWYVAAVLAPVCLAVGHEGHLELSLFLVGTATLYSARHLGSTSRVVLITAACSGGIVVTSRVSDGGFSSPPWVIAEILLLVVGRTLFRQDTLVGELQAAREALAEQAVAEERRRIARELHDVAGHTLAAVMLHVTGARHVLRRDPVEAERALLDAEAVGRASMEQIRETVETLRTIERGVDPPPPDADRLDDLIEEYRRAGLVVESTIAPGVAALRGPSGVAVHRIVRESLANVARHAPTNRVSIDASVVDGAVRLAVSDHGRSVPQVDRGTTGRFGLVGMSERARSLGGVLSAGPTADGWRVRAHLPVPTEPVASPPTPAGTAEPTVPITAPTDHRGGGRQ